MSSDVKLLSSAFHGVTVMYPKREFLSDEDEEKDGKVSDVDRSITQLKLT